MTRIYNAVKSFLAIIGLAALAGLVLLPESRDALLAQLPWTEPRDARSASPVAAGAIHPRSADLAIESEREVVAGFIARRYRVSEFAVSRFVELAVGFLMGEWVCVAFFSQQSVRSL